MTELEQAYNLGVSGAVDALRLAARTIPDCHSLGSAGLLSVADAIEGLKIGDPMRSPDQTTLAVEAA
jgi:hypothetical protein